jgi:hypothetical protein
MNAIKNREKKVKTGNYRKKPARTGHRMHLRLFKLHVGCEERGNKFS